MNREKAKNSFTYKGTVVQTGHTVEWYCIQPSDGSPAFFRVRNHSNGAEMKLSPQELDLVVRLILNRMPAEIIEGE